MISVIVPAYNEEKNILKVLKALDSFSVIDEAICVSDGSTDSTARLIKDFSQRSNKTKALIYKVNKGKGFAMAKGLRAANGSTIVFLDADLVYLNESHLKLLLKPLLKNTHRVSIGCLHSKVLPLKIFSKISGQRAYMKSDLLKILEKMEKSRFGVEIVLNKELKDLKTKVMLLKDLKHIPTYTKRNTTEAFREEIGMFLEIFIAMLRYEKATPNVQLTIRELKLAKSRREFLQKIDNLAPDIKKYIDDGLLKYLKLNFNKLPKK